MEVFLARQPIFNRMKKVVAYEILYRNGNKNTYDLSINGDLATASVVVDALVNFGLGTLTSNRIAYINFTRKLILEDLPSLFAADRLTIELLETAEVDDLLVDKIAQYKSMGYTIALDDFIGDERFDAVIPYVDIIKVDFLILKSEGRKFIAEKYKPLGVQLLAEKVESDKDYQEALEWGYDLFQGYFFEKPIICKTKSISVTTFRYMEILKETMNEEPDFNHLAEIIRKDFSLTYKLLRLINSPAFYTVSEITSVNHALTLLGLNEIRKWTTLIMLRDISAEKPDELVRVSLVRALFAEKLSSFFDVGHRKTEAFLLGLFSLIDTIMEKPLFEVIEPLPLKKDLKSALMGDPNVFHAILKLLKHYEMGNFDQVISISDNHGIPYTDVNRAYLEAVDEANRLYEMM